MRYLIVVEPVSGGVAVEVPDLAVVTRADDIGSAKQAAAEAIRVNLEAYIEEGREIPEPLPVETHLTDPGYQDLLFAYVEVPMPSRRVAA